MWYLNAMRHCVDFQGRACRLEFWEFLGGWFLLTMVAVGIERMNADSYPQEGHLLASIVAAIHLLPFCAVAARRSHDLDRSGWLAVLGLVPLLGFAMLLVWSLPGTAGMNRYGLEPNAKPNAEASPATGPNRSQWQATRSAPETNFSAALKRSSADVLDVVDELDRLAGLLFSGALTDEEFELLKQRSLKKVL